MTRKMVRALTLGLVGLLIAAITVLAALPTGHVAADTGSNWSGQYWNNPDLSGNPSLTRTDAAINFNWGTGSPDPAIQADNFSARWTLTQNFNAGAYSFRIGADDGMRFFIDDISILDRFGGFGSGFGTATATVNLGAGQHTLRVEYVERSGQAGALFDWTTTAGSTVATSGPTVNPNLVTATFTGPTAAYGQRLCEVIVDFANIRQDPSTQNPAIGQARYGQRFTMVATDRTNTWFKVDLGGGQFGWLYRSVIYLFPGSTDNLPEDSSSVAVVSAAPTQPATGTARTGIILRAEASRRADKVGAINEGENFQIIARSRYNRAWVQVQLSNGQVGWVFTPYIIITSGSLGALPVR
jgi:uncharacterized protein YraI